MKSSAVKVGVIGAGFISDQYLSNLVTYPDIEVVAVGDIVEDRAREQAEKYGVPGWGAPDAVIANPEIEIVVNLTIAPVHASVSTQALEAGKHAWSEKPLATTHEDSAALLALAEERGLIIGCAPDTFLGPGIQTSLRLLREGVIGDPVAAQGIMQMAGPERWHPNPEFIFQDVGPLVDLAPYYFTALVQIFGAVANVSALETKSTSSRTIRVGPRAGTEFEVTVPTHTQALLEFVGGGQAQTTFSFDTEIGREGFLEIIGTNGMLVATDPNRFDGTVVIHRDGREPEEIVVDPAGAGRGIGVVEIARAIRSGDPRRATGELADYVLHVISAVQRAAAERSVVAVGGDVEPAPLLPQGWSPTQATFTAG